MYDHNIVLIVPLESLDIAKSINRHLDQDDVGGGEGFSTKLIKDNKEYSSYSRLCNSDYASKAALLVTIPEELFELCKNDTRFDTKPTIEDCIQFCDKAEAYVDCQPEGYLPLEVNQEII